LSGEHDDTVLAQQNHLSERGRATSVGNADAVGRPHRSVLALARTHIMEKSKPTFGILSVVIPVLGFCGLVLGIGADTGAGVFIALFCLGVAPVLGLFFGTTALVMKERFAIIPVAGLLGSLVFIAWYWRLFR